MLSIFIMYSPDRQNALEIVLGCLQDMPLYMECQKTLVVDGKCNILLPEWHIVEVPRVDDGKFSWANMWDVGVGTARHENVLYLDSDRLLPINYLEVLLPQIKDDVFVFTSNHFMMLKEMPLGACKRMLRDGVEDFVGCARYEPRFKDPVHGPGKNVMSGSTAFTKKTYYRLGGVDPWYRGHGAYADTDFHFTAKVGGCQFVDIGNPEYHYPHPKREGDQELKKMELRRLGLDNYIHYCYKWGLPMALAENIAHECNLRRPDKYVAVKAEEIREELGKSPWDLSK